MITGVVIIVMIITFLNINAVFVINVMMAQIT